MGYGKSGRFDGEGDENIMVTFAILAAIMGAGCIVCIMALYALHRLTGGKMSLKKWIHLNFDF